MSDQQTPKLLKPRFIKIKDLQKGRNGYNVFAKVIQATPKDIQTQDGRTIKMVDAIIGDQTGTAKAFFKGQEVSFIKKGQVIAIRNGMRKMIKGHISLEIDMFGRVTKENGEDIKINQTHNISEIQFQTSMRRQDRAQRPPRRGQSNFKNQQRFNRSQDRRPNRNNNNSFQSRRNQNNSSFRNTQGQRNDDRGNNRYNKNRDRDNDFNRYQRNSAKSLPRATQRPKYEEKKSQYREQRTATQFSKINEIQPGDSDINILAQIVSVTQVKGKVRNMVRCVLGDETGVVNAFLADDSRIVKGDTIALFRCESKVIKEHIQIQLGQRGTIERGRKQIKTVNEQFDLSSKAWVPVE